MYANMDVARQARESATAADLAKMDQSRAALNRIFDAMGIPVNTDTLCAFVAGRALPNADVLEDAAMDAMIELGWKANDWEPY